MHLPVNIKTPVWSLNAGRFYWGFFEEENALASATFPTSAHLISGDKL
jgi:hypothetical protein